MRGFTGERNRSRTIGNRVRPDKLVNSDTTPLVSPPPRPLGDDGDSVCASSPWRSGNLRSQSGHSVGSQHRIKVVIAATVATDVAVSDTEKIFAGVDGLHLRWLPAVCKISNTPVGMGWARRLQQIAREENIDIVNAHAPVPFVADIAASACPELPFVLTYHSAHCARASGGSTSGCEAMSAGSLPIRCAEQTH